MRKGDAAFQDGCGTSEICQLSQSNIQSLQSRKTSSNQADLQTKTQCRSHGVVQNLRFIGLYDCCTLRRVRLCLTTPSTGHLAALIQVQM